MKFLKIRSSKKYIKKFKQSSFFFILKSFLLKENDNTFFKNYLKNLEIFSFNYSKYNIKEIKRLLPHSNLKTSFSGDLRFLFFKTQEDFITFIKSLDLNNLFFLPLVTYFDKRCLNLVYFKNILKNNQFKTNKDLFFFFITFKIMLLIKFYVILKLKHLQKLKLFLTLKKNVNA